MDDLSPGINFNKIIDKKNSPTIDGKKELKSRIKELEEEELALMREFNLSKRELLPKIRKIGEPIPQKKEKNYWRIESDDEFVKVFSMYYDIEPQDIPKSFAKLINESQLDRYFRMYGPNEIVIEKIVSRFEMFKRFDEYGEPVRTSFMEVSTLGKEKSEEVYDNLLSCFYGFFNSINWSLVSKNINIYTMKMLTHLLCRRFYVVCTTGGTLGYDENENGDGILKYTDSVGDVKIVDLQWLRQFVRLQIDLPTEAKRVKEFESINGGVICVRLVLLMLGEDSNFELVVTDNYDRE